MPRGGAVAVGPHQLAAHRRLRLLLPAAGQVLGCVLLAHALPLPRGVRRRPGLGLHLCSEALLPALARVVHRRVCHLLLEDPRRALPELPGACLLAVAPPRLVVRHTVRVAHGGSAQRRGVCTGARRAGAVLQHLGDGAPVAVRRDRAAACRRELCLCLVLRGRRPQCGRVLRAAVRLLLALVDAGGPHRDGGLRAREQRRLGLAFLPPRQRARVLCRGLPAGACGVVHLHARARPDGAPVGFLLLPRLHGPRAAALRPRLRHALLRLLRPPALLPLHLLPLLCAAHGRRAVPSRGLLQVPELRRVAREQAVRLARQQLLCLVLGARRDRLAAAVRAHLARHAVRQLLRRAVGAVCAGGLHAQRRLLRDALWLGFNRRLG